MISEIECIVGPCFAAFASSQLGFLSLAIFGTIALLSAYKIVVKGALRSRIAWSYSLVFSIIFLSSYFLLSMGCHDGLPICTERPVAYSLPLAAIGVIIFGYILLPNIYLRWHKTRVSRELSALLPTHIPVHIADKGKPFAFSYGGLSRWIVVSQGMIEVLSPKELEAVLLHEYYHVSRHSSVLKVGNWLYSKIPLARSFLSDERLEDMEELDADSFSMRMQGTKRYLNSAKKKLRACFNDGF